VSPGSGSMFCELVWTPREFCEPYSDRGSVKLFHGAPDDETINSSHEAAFRSPEDRLKPALAIK
jgi:hypothetical protein